MRSLVLKSVAVVMLLGCCGCVRTTGPEEKPPGPPIVVSIDSLDVYSGRRFAVNLRIGYNPTDGDTLGPLGGFSFLVRYDPSLLTSNGVGYGPAIAGWEYLTFRLDPVPSCPSCLGGGFIQVIAIRDLNNGKTPRSEASTHPDGVVATLNFGAALNTDARGKCSRLDFYSANCQHNLLSADSSRIRYAPDPGVGELILDQYYDTTSCTQLGLSMIPAIAYTSGTVCIRTDSPPAVTGDINLDGAGPDVGDVVGFINYYFRRLPLGSPTDPTLRALLVAACDVNGDGHPLTLADFENLFRIAFRGFDPVPPLPPYVDTLFVDIQPESDGFRLNTHATIVVDGVYIEVEHPRQHDHFARWEGERSARTTGYEIGDVTGYVFEHFTNAGPGSINGPDPILDTAREAPIFLSSNPRGGIRILSVEGSTFPGVEMAVRITMPDSLRGLSADPRSNAPVPLSRR